MRQQQNSSVLVSGSFYLEGHCLKEMLSFYNPLHPCHQGARGKWELDGDNRNGYNYFWSVDNSKEVLDKLNNPSSIHTYDFSTLYTNLPLDLVRNELFEMIDRYFDINERKSNKYIVLNHFWVTAQFASVNRKGSYDRDKLKTALDYLHFNSFVRFGPHVFKQIKGIPMGGNASPLIADLFLANLEFRYMDKLVSFKSPENLRMAKK